MKEPNWIATKKEFTFDAEGKQIPEKITYEKAQRNWWDFTIKSFGVFAIFVPLLLLFIQRCNDKRSENSKAAAELFTSISIDLESVKTATAQTPEFQKACKNILYNYYPRVHLLKNDSLNQIFSNVIDCTNYQALLVNLKDNMDSLNVKFNDFDPYMRTTIEQEGSSVSKEQKQSFTKTIEECAYYAEQVSQNSKIISKTFGSKKIGGVNNALQKFFTDTLSNTSRAASVYFMLYYGLTNGIVDNYPTDWEPANQKFKQIISANARVKMLTEINIDDIKRLQTKFEKQVVATL